MSVSLVLFAIYTKYRIYGVVLLFGISLLYDFQTNLVAYEYKYEPEGNYKSTDWVVSSGPKLQPAIINIIAGFTAAFAAFLFIGLQFQTMSLSRESLLDEILELKQTNEKNVNEIKFKRQLNVQLTFATKLLFVRPKSTMKSELSNAIEGACSFECEIEVASRNITNSDFKIEKKTFKFEGNLRKVLMATPKTNYYIIRCWI